MHSVASEVVRRGGFGVASRLACPHCGPVLVTPDELPGDGLDVTSIVDGEVMQHANTADLVFSPAFLVSYLSRIVTLNPGDVIATGTPGGVGHARTPKRYLTDGSTVSAEVAGIGATRNRVAVMAPVPA